MTPLLKTFSKYIAIASTCLIIGWMLNASCNKPDTSYYDNQVKESVRKIKILQTEKDSVLQRISILEAQKEKQTQDSINIVYLARELAKANRTNQGLRALLANQSLDSSYLYSNDTLTNAENDSLFIELAECKGVIPLYKTALQTISDKDFVIRGCEQQSAEKDNIIESLQKKVQAIDPHPLDKFWVGAGVVGLAVVIYKIIVEFLK